MLEQTRERLRELAASQGLLQAPVAVRVKPLTPEEAIGQPQRRNYPIIVGKERVIEATVRDARGQAFTDSPCDLRGTVDQVLALELSSNGRRAVFVATCNALLRHLGQVGGTVHCKDEDPERCGAQIAEQLYETCGAETVGLVGLNPAIAEQLVQCFGAAQLRITDLNQDNIGQRRFGVEIWSGNRLAELVAAADLLLVTGTTLVNGTFDEIYGQAQAAGKRLIVYGVTGAGVCQLLGIERICPCSQDG